MHKTMATSSIDDTSADQALPADKSTTQFPVQTSSSEIYPASTLDRNKEAVGLLYAMEQKTRSAEQESFLGKVMLGLLYAMEKKTRSAEHESLLGDVMLRLLNAMEKKTRSAEHESFLSEVILDLLKAMEKETRSAEHESFLGEVMLGLLNAMEKKTRRAEHESSLDKDISGCTFDVYIGLPNEGNTCFLNTLLQCLFLTPEFRDKLSECENNGGKTLLAVENIFNVLREKERQYVTTSELTACLGLQPFKQQDVPEVFLLLLNKLDEELSNGSYFKELYASTTVNLTECTQCETKDGLDMECNIVILPLPVSSVRSREKPWSVAAALEHFLKSTEMKGENQIYCTNCSGKTDATLRQALTSLPRILVLQLKRFEFRFYEQSFVKLENEMHINTTLEVPCEKTSQKDKKSYDLFAICDHYGGFKSGHYSALIKPEENGKWFRFNDSTVTSEEIQISDPEIGKSFWEASSGNKYDLSSSRTAYMLMYRQKLERKPQKSEDATVPAYQWVPQPRTGGLRNAERTSEGKEVRSRSWGALSTGASLATEGETTPPDQQPVLEDRSVGDDFLPSMNEDTFQQPLDSTETSSPVTARGDSITGSPEGPPPTEHAPTASQIPSMDSEDPQVVFERQAIGAHQQLVDERCVGLETIAGTLEGVCMGLSPNKDTYETFKNTYPSLQRMEQSLADIASVMRQRQQQQPWQSDTSEIATQLGAIHTIFQSMEQKQDSFIATMRAFHHDIVALLINHQALFSAVLLTLLAQTNAAGDRGATSSAPDVCVPQMPPAQTQHTSEEEEVDFIKF